MPYVKRKRARSMPRRRIRRRRRTFKKRSRKMVMFKKPNQYSFKMAVDMDFINGWQLSTVGAPQSIVVQFSPYQILNFQNYLLLFERMQINACVFTYQVARTETVVTQDNSSTSANPQGNIPQLLSFFDYNTNDPGTFTSDEDLIEKFSEYGNLKRQLCNRPYNRKFQPRLLEPFLSDFDANNQPRYGYSSGKKKPWIELNSTEAQKTLLWPALHIGLTSDAITSNSSRFLLRPTAHMYVTFAGKRQ